MTDQVIDVPLEPKEPWHSRDVAFFFEGLRSRRLLAQRCTSCQLVRHPPAPACPSCNSLDWTTDTLSTGGTIFSYVIHHHPPLPDYPTPHAIALIELDDGPRLLSAITACDVDALAIGQRVEAEFFTTSTGFDFFRFRPLSEHSK